MSHIKTVSKITVFITLLALIVWFGSQYLIDHKNAEYALHSIDHNYNKRIRFEIAQGESVNREQLSFPEMESGHVEIFEGKLKSSIPYQLSNKTIVSTNHRDLTLKVSIFPSVLVNGSKRLLFTVKGLAECSSKRGLKARLSTDLSLSEMPVEIDKEAARTEELLNSPHVPEYQKEMLGMARSLSLGLKALDSKKYVYVDTSCFDGVLVVSTDYEGMEFILDRLLDSEYITIFNEDIAPFKLLFYIGNLYEVSTEIDLYHGAL